MRTNIPDSYLSPVTDDQSKRSTTSKGSKMSMGSMHEKLRKINEEFKARSCVGSGFVFSKNVKLESPVSYFNREDAVPKSLSGSFIGNIKTSDINKLEAGVFVKKEATDGRHLVSNKDVSRKDGMSLYRKQAIEVDRAAVQHRSVPDTVSVDFKPVPGYVKSVVNSSMFNKDHGANSAFPTSRMGKKVPPSSLRDGFRSSPSVSRSIFSNPLSNNEALKSVRSSQSVVNLKTSYGRPSEGPGDDRPLSRSVAHTCKHGSRLQSPALAPINVMYIESTQSKTPEESRAVASSPVEHSSADKVVAIPLYGPGPKLTIYPRIRISSTVLNYEDGWESTAYYITIESNISWTVCKSIKELISIMPNVKCTTPSEAMSPQDRKVRDGIIQAMLNSKLDRRLQAFILSDISETSTFRSSYLLMNSDGWKAYLFKFVGKALICYEKSKVYKIFLLSGCEVSPIGIDGFNLRKSGEGIELYATCERERDTWMSDIRKYVAGL